MLSGSTRFRCDGEESDAGPGDFVFLPVGLPPRHAVELLGPPPAA